MTIILPIIGVALLGLAFWQYQKVKKFLDSGTTTVGTVIRVEKSESTSTDEDGFSSTSTSYYPVLEFTDQNGKKHEFKASVGGNNKNKWKISQTTEIIYDPTNPKKASIKSFMQLWFTTLLLGFFGGVLTVMGVAAL